MCRKNLKKSPGLQKYPISGLKNDPHDLGEFSFRACNVPSGNRSALQSALAGHESRGRNPVVLRGYFGLKTKENGYFSHAGDSGQGTWDKNRPPGLQTEAF